MRSYLGTRPYVTLSKCIFPWPGSCDAQAKTCICPWKWINYLENAAKEVKIALFWFRLTLFCGPYLPLFMSCSSYFLWFWLYFDIHCVLSNTYLQSWKFSALFLAYSYFLPTIFISFYGLFIWPLFNVILSLIGPFYAPIFQKVLTAFKNIHPWKLILITLKMQWKLACFDFGWHLTKKLRNRFMSTNLRQKMN